jgi:hypothetical protein
VIIFGSVWFLLKKSNQTEFFLKKKPKQNRNRVKPAGFGSVRFFRAKTGSNRFGSIFPILARFSRFWLGFFRFWLGFFLFSLVFSVWLGFGSVFPVWLGFFSSFLSVSVRFGFFGFLFIKPKPNRTGRFFQKINRFNRFFFSVNFFLVFSV